MWALLVMEFQSKSPELYCEFKFEFRTLGWTQLHKVMKGIFSEITVFGVGDFITTAWMRIAGIGGFDLVGKTDKRWLNCRS